VFRRLATAVLLTIALVLVALAPVYAADPTPAVSPAASPVFIDPLDPRAGAGAPSVGAPVVALVVVVSTGVVAAAATVVFVRVTRRA
jgi:hypothetical protein